MPVSVTVKEFNVAPTDAALVAVCRRGTYVNVIVFKRMQSGGFEMYIAQTYKDRTLTFVCFPCPAEKYAIHNYIEAFGDSLITRFRLTADISLDGCKLWTAETRFLDEFVTHWRNHSIRRGPILPKYVISPSDKTAYRLTSGGFRWRRGRRRFQLAKVSLKTAFTELFWRGGDERYIAYVQQLGQMLLSELLGLALLQVSAQEGRYLVGDRRGNLFLLAEDQTLHLFDRHLIEVYNFGRLPIDGCEQPRMCLHELHELLFIWSGTRSGYLKVFDLKRGQLLSPNR